MPAALLVVLATALGGMAQAQQAFPNRPVRIIIPFTPGARTTSSRAFSHRN